MIIYKMKPDTDYRTIEPESDAIDSEVWNFKCNPLAGRLKQFSATFDKDSDKPIPDIAYIGAATFAFKDEVAEELVEILERAGELLPFYVDEELWYCFNVLESLNALNEESSRYTVKENGFELDIHEYAFYAERLSNTSLFKIPNDNHTNIYCVDRRETDEQVLENFFCALAGHEFTGIKFEEIYSED